MASGWKKKGSYGQSNRADSGNNEIRELEKDEMCDQNSRCQSSKRQQQRLTAHYGMSGTGAAVLLAVEQTD